MAIYQIIESPMNGIYTSLGRFKFDGFRKKATLVSLRAKRSNLIQCKCLNLQDCFVAPLLAMTGEKTFYEFIKYALLRCLTIPTT